MQETSVTVERFRYGYGGKSCILRTVCEAADTVIDKNNGLLDEIAHAVFT